MPTIHIARQHTQQTCQGSILGRNLGDGGQQQMCGTLVIHVLLGRPRSLPKPSLFKSSNPGRKTLSCRSWGLLNSMIIGHPPIAWPEHGLGCDTRVVSQGGGTFASVLLCQQMSPQLGIKSSSPSSGSLRGLGPSGAEWQGRIAGGFAPSAFLFDEALLLIWCDEEGGGQGCGKFSRSCACGQFLLLEASLLGTTLLSLKYY